MTGSTKPSKPFLLGVAGGSGSGKTYFAQSVLRALGQDCCEIILQDNFYHDQSKKFDHDGGSVNFDHPDSIDFQLLAKCLGQLKGGTQVEIPTYDFSTHTRTKKKLLVAPKSILIVDGILIFYAPEVRSLFDELIFFDTPEEIRFKRRLDRDINERGRTLAGVKAQFELQVKPMHDKFVEPSKKHAHRVVEEDQVFDDLLRDYISKLKKRL